MQGIFSKFSAFSAFSAVNSYEKKDVLGWRKRLSPVWLAGLSLVFFVLLTTLVLWPLTAHLATSVNNEGDDLQQMASVGWVMHSLTHDPANLFNATIFYPYPNTLAYSDNLIPQALLALPVYLLTNNLILSFNLVVFGTFVLSGWGMFWLVRDLTGSIGAGLFAGTIFAFAPYKVAHLSQLNLLSIQWLPFAFWCLHRTLTADINAGSLTGPGSFWKRLRSGWGWLAGFGCFFVLQSLSSIYYFLYALPLYLLYFVGLYLFERRWPSPALLVKLLLVGIVATLIMLPTLLPYWQVSNSQTAERTTREIDEFAANYRFYLGVPDNNLLWASTLGRFGGSGGERRLFPGALAYLFAFLALLGPLVLSLYRRVRPVSSKPVQLSPKDKSVEEGATSDNFDPTVTNKPDTAPLLAPHSSRVRYLYLLVGLFALIMSFGLTLHIKGLDIGLPYRIFYAYFPGWKGLRAVMRYGVFVLFAVSVLAGFGLVWLQKTLAAPTRLQNWGQKQKLTRYLPGAGLALLLAATFWEYRSDITYTRPAVLSEPPAVYSWLAAPARAGPILELPMAAGPDLPSIHNFYSTLNWQPTVNGEAGYTPPVYSDLVAATQPDRLLSSQTLAALQGMGVRWLVWHLNDESMPLDSAQWQKLQPQLDNSPLLKLAYNSPTDRVYELAPDPWMTRLSQMLPAHEGLYISDFRRQQPLLTELTETILERNQHPLYGNDRAGYRFLPPAPTGLPVAYGLFAANEDPSLYGFSPDEVVWSNTWLKLYKRQANLLAAYDIVRDPVLAGYNQVKNELQIRLEVEGVRLGENQLLGNGQRLLGNGQLELTFGSLAAQTITLMLPDGSKQPLDLAPGLTTWRSQPLPPSSNKRGTIVKDTVIKIEPNPTQSLYLNRVASLEWQPGNPTGVTSQPNAALLQTATHQEGNVFVSSFVVYAPGDSNTHYNFTLDVYKRPWGSANSGHFGNWTVALTGQKQPQTVEFRFDPTTHQTSVSIAAQPANIGAQPLDTRDGPYSTYISLWQLNGQNATQIGVARLYDFTLDNGKINETDILAGRELVFVPPLAK